MKRKWTEDEMRILRELYPHTRTDELCNILNRSASSIYGQAYAHGIKKTQEFINYLLSLEADRLRKSGAATRYKKGNDTWNKGKKGFMGPNVTSFKKGNKPHNTREVGSIRIDGKDKFLLVKVADKVWIRKEILIWEEVNGPIPKGCVVRVKDPRQNKYEINNLMLISRGHNMKLNTMHRYPEELKKTMRALQKLKRTIKKNGKKQN
jgi:hypothetical protein